MIQTIESLFFYLVFLFDLLIIGYILFVLKQKKRTETGLIIILAHCLLNSATNYTTKFSSLSYDYLLFSFYTLIEYLLFSYFLWLNISNFVFRRVVVLLSLLFCVFVVVYTFSTENSIDAIPIGVETILILIYSFYYLFEQMNNVKTLYIYDKYQFWFVAGFMIYLSGSFFIYIFTNDASKEVLDKFWFLTYVFYIIKNLLFGIGITILLRQLRKPQVNNLQPYLN
ncbi:MAG: hypothetical protein ICV66_04270 [Chitinophagaceae bacterium]|nr:hypothetical protein [Chitinophagaceae bacterium]